MLNSKAQLTVDVIAKVAENKITIVNAVKLLNKSRRTVERYLKRYREVGIRFVVHGYSVADVAARLDISTKSLYGWMKSFSKPTKQRKEDEDLRTEIARLKRELKRAQQERDILKEAAESSLPASQRTVPVRKIS